MKVRCTATFRDLETGFLRVAGEVFEVTEERFDKINSTKYGTLAVTVEEEPEPEKPKRRGRPRKTEQTEQE